MLTTLVAFTTLALSQQSSHALTEVQKSQAIESLISALNESYVFEELAKEAEVLLKKSIAEGTYKDITSGNAFALRLSSDVNAVLKDAHFRMQYSAAVLLERVERSQPSAEEIAAQRKGMLRRNAGFERVERLPGNIGYIEVTGFMDPALFRSPCTAAFNFVANTDALILDLRRNGGGSPESVRLLCSYLFGDEPVHLNSLYFRATDSTTEYWTTKEVPGQRYGLERPVYVLTSKRTGSGAEECAYNLQTRKRSTTIGEVTWGDANPGGVVRLNDHFSAFIPTGRAINPITKTNWEGVGVQPDVAASSSDSLTKAQILALEQLVKTADADWRRELQRRIDRLKSEMGGEIITLFRSVSDLM